MREQSESQARLGRVLIGGLIVAAGVMLCGCISVAGYNSTSQPQTAHSTSTPPPASYQYDDPNAVTAGLGGLVHDVGQVFDGLGQAADDGLRSFGALVGRGGMLLYVGLRNSALFVGRGLLYGIVCVARTPAAVADSVSDAAVVGSVTRPGDTTEIPSIEPLPSGQLTAKVPVSAAEAPSPANQNPTSPGPASPATRWPIHGAITTLFGVPELPYQAIHTGIDISDGSVPGTTPIKAFKSGNVIATIWSSGGLGNHVIIDHGNGMTSVYGHMASISVQVGQTVDTATTIGYEGTTGVSTGTHVHFEIRINNQPVNPQLYIVGQP